MTLNIGASGTIKPYAKYNSKADKWFIKQRVIDIIQQAQIPAVTIHRGHSKCPDPAALHALATSRDN